MPNKSATADKQENDHLATEALFSPWTCATCPGNQD